jgi:hypothetical protein
MLLFAFLYLSADYIFRQFFWPLRADPATYFRILWGVIALIFAAIGIEHLIKKRWIRSIVFFAFAILWFRSGQIPFSRLPQQIMVYGNPLDSITVFGSLVPFLWIIVDAVRQPVSAWTSGTSQSTGQMGAELRTNWFVFPILGILSFGGALGLAWIASMIFDFWDRSQLAQSTTFIGGMVGVYILGLRLTKTWRKNRISEKV